MSKPSTQVAAKTRETVIKALKAATRNGAVVIDEQGKARFNDVLDLNLLLKALLPRAGVSVTEDQVDLIRAVVAHYPDRKMSVLEVWQEIHGYGFEPPQGAFRHDGRGWTVRGKRLAQTQVSAALRELDARGEINLEHHDSGRIARVLGLARDRTPHPFRNPVGTVC